MAHARFALNRTGVCELITLAIVRGVVKFTSDHECTSDLRSLILGHLVILSVCIVLEAAIAFISTRGSILTQAPRASIEYLLYIRAGELSV
ncbi:Sn1-specific diacylglycerol lipase alpha [Elysia marginata]|uniref:Sn1-specific diacylglycerol lipase alpha n=1 Tax=Elysia marginata TaxID=1093978 RepID=A0AAV4FRB2_9GAST|nr:Sn1-specific diacylglycerol lipase alpha [Elysia marginata]